jgi:23S rRNA (adenine2503-C2)-methyltransferase
MISTRFIEGLIKSSGEKSFRIKQALKSYRDLGDFSDTALPSKLREHLNTELDKLNKKKPAFDYLAESTDGTRKVLLKTHDGYLFESVLIPHESRNTLCISSQIGCSVKCAFCLTGTVGFKRNLTAEEIVYQAEWWTDYLQKNDLGKIDNIVYMGQGEPFLNFDEVVESLKTLNEPNLTGFGSRRMTVSTSGIIPNIYKFAEVLGGQVNLAISIHAGTQETRAKLVPIAHSMGMDMLMQSAYDYVSKTSRKIFFEYCLLKGVNDTDEEIEETCRLLSQNKLFHLNLINYNFTDLGFEKTSGNRIKAFYQKAEEYGIPVTLRLSHGGDNFAACGQLGNRVQGSTRKSVET